MCTPACLLAASISVEAVTPPLVGWAFKELLLFCGGSAGKSNAYGVVSITPVGYREHYLLLWTRAKLWTGIRSAIHNSDRCRNGLRGIGLCGCGYSHVIAARNRIRGQITDGNSTGCPSRGKRAAGSDGSAGETYPAVHGIVGDGRGDTRVRASIERSRWNKALAKRNRNRRRRRALTTAGDQYGCHRYADDSFDNQ